MNHDAYSDAYIRGILGSVKSVAIVGASANTIRPSFFVAKYLIDKGYDVFPINPGQAGRDISGRKTFASLADVPEHLDMVDIFRPIKFVPAIVSEILNLDPLPRIVWMQLTIRDDAAADKLERAGIQVVMNRCPKIEYARLCGEISWNGINSHVISAKKPLMRSRFQNLQIETYRSDT